MKFKPEFKAKLVAALRSGKYAQGKGQLRKRDEFCCLGVACDLFDPNGWVDIGDNRWMFKSELNTAEWLPKSWEEADILPANVAVSIIEGYPETQRTDFTFNELQVKAATDLIAQRDSDYESFNNSLAAMNDSTLFTFDDIADFIEQ